MAYTRPSASAADVTWVTSFAYTRPVSSASDLDFRGGGVASGFTSTALGTPYALFPQYEDATGFLTGAFGTATGGNYQRPEGIAPTVAFGLPDLKPIAVGFKPTVFGTATNGRTQHATGSLFGTFLSTVPGEPQSFKKQRPTGFSTTQYGESRLFPMHAVGFKPTTFGLAHVVPGWVPGFLATHIGDINIYQHWDSNAIWWPVTNFGTPTTPTDRTQEASGFDTTTFGNALALSYIAPNLARTCLTYGIHSLHFGAPRALPTQFALTTGFMTHWNGTPRARISQSADSVASSLIYGTATVRFTTHPVGSKVTLFGAPVIRRHDTKVASGLYQDTRFGLPKVYRPTAYLAYGINASNRIGHPVALNRFNHPATGFTSTLFGAPACYQRHRVSHMAPATRFGRPLLRRNLICGLIVRASGSRATHLGTPSC